MVLIIHLNIHSAYNQNSSSIILILAILFITFLIKILNTVVGYSAA